jgi:sulfatase modifying factor 1
MSQNPFIRVTLFVAACSLGLSTSILHAQVTFDWATVGDPNNAPDQLYTGQYRNNLRFGAVMYTYRISKHAVTNDQYAEFLNAMDPTGTNPNSAYNSNMGSDPRGGIAFNAGVGSGSKYS